MSKPDFATRVITALARHERAAGEIGIIKKAISDSLEKCPITIQANAQSSIFSSQSYPQEGLELWDGSRIRHHLHEVLQLTIDTGSGYGGERKLDADEIREELSGYNDDPLRRDDRSLGCPHCLAAWDLIIKRKEVRHELGNAKRALRNLGKTAMKVTE